MRFSKVRKMDISNGPGVRVSLFVQGCTFNCPNCFNPETHDFNGGREYNEEIQDRILGLCRASHIVGLSILGGEPLHPKNIDEVTKLAKKFKSLFPEKSLWVWSGFLYEDLKDREIMKHIDVMVDGKYMDELHSPMLHWKGSSNQRVIDVKESRKQNKIVLYCED